MSLLRGLFKKFSRHNRIAIYTAITGNYDELRTPKYVSENCDYICFTDNINLKSDFWEIRLMQDSELDPVRKARKHKVLPHMYLKEYDSSIWIDGNFDIVGDMNEVINKYSNESGMLCIIHPQRNCVYEEAKACIELNKDSEDIINNQIEKYLADNYPKNNGMIASGVLYRKHRDAKLVKVMEAWWKEIYNRSRRDQLSFNYVCWKYQYKYDECDLSYWGNNYFKRVTHN